MVLLNYCKFLERLSRQTFLQIGVLEWDLRALSPCEARICEIPHTFAFCCICTVALRAHSKVFGVLQHVVMIEMGGHDEEDECWMALMGHDSSCTPFCGSGGCTY